MNNYDCFALVVFLVFGKNVIYIINVQDNYKSCSLTRSVDLFDGKVLPKVISKTKNGVVHYAVLSFVSICS